MAGFYRTIDDLRRQNKITLADVSKKSGIPASVWSWMEKNGDSAPSYNDMRKIVVEVLRDRGSGLQSDIEEAITDAQTKDQNVQAA